MLRSLIIVALAAAVSQAHAQAPIAQSGIARYVGREGQTHVRAPRVGEEPDIDGRLTEADWGRAATLTGFSQYTPVDRLPADDSTEVLVMYSETAIYFGIRAFE